MIRSETQGRVARIRFDRLDKKNAITAEMYAQLGPRSPRPTPTAGARCSCTTRADCFTAGNDVGDFLKCSTQAGCLARARFSTRCRT